MPWPYMRFKFICHEVKRVSGKNDLDGILIDIGQAIRVERKRANLSQESLAHQAGIDRSHMGRIERGERNVTLINVHRIAAALNLKISELTSKAGL